MEFQTPVYTQRILKSPTAAKNGRRQAVEVRILKETEVAADAQLLSPYLRPAAHRQLAASPPARFLRSRRQGCVAATVAAVYL